MKIATWNVNSIRVRLPHVIDFIKKQSPDVLLLQELKAQDHDIPKSDLEDTGYNVIFKGQKAYNGVAILSKYPVSDIVTSLYEDEDHNEQARYIECWVDSKNSGIRVASIYLPNGNPINTEKFIYKIEWMTKLKQHVEKLLDNEESIILGGDFNVCPEDRDAANPEAMKNDALFQPESRAKLREIINLGYYDAWRALNPNKTNWSYWDYGRAFEQNKGLRIDHFLLSPFAIDKLQSIEIDTYHRSLEKPSDHAPVIINISD
ncbi:MAG: exodeoxyribonuclease III [Alphaproteobacteria bacterium]|tara:strand:+ start:719 stop:1501 length:783 start_codon:yes stop_codon:yes gene_type:complete